MKCDQLAWINTMELLIVNDAVLEAKTMKNDILWNEYLIDQVHIAFNAKDAKDIIKTYPIDIILCDIEMPGENGLSLIHWINSQGYDIDCVLLTCHADFSYAREAVSLNCQEYLLLPAKYTEIGECVKRTCLQRQKRLREKQLQEYGKNWISEKNTALQSSIAKKPKEIVEECIQYIYNNIGNEELSVTLLAEHFHMNAVYLNRIFKKEKEITISQWIIRERMQLARHLLETPGNSAMNIALQVGYSNYPYFSSTFKKMYNCTPSQYAQQFQNNEHKSI